MIYFKGEYAKIIYHKLDKMVEIIWTATHTDSSKYRLTLTKALIVVKQYEVNKWLSDMSIMEKVTREDREWVEDYLIANAAENGVQKAAFVLSTEMYDKIHTSEFHKTVEEHKIKAQSFRNRSDAIKWLKQK